MIENLTVIRDTLRVDKKTKDIRMTIVEKKIDELERNGLVDFPSFSDDFVYLSEEEMQDMNPDGEINLDAEEIDGEVEMMVCPDEYRDLFGDNVSLPSDKNAAIINGGSLVFFTKNNWGF